MRTVSLDFRKAAYARETGDIPVALVTITHPELPQPARFSSDRTQRISVDPLIYGTISNGRQFLFVGMKATMPDDRDRSPMASRLTINDIERQSIPLVRAIRTPPPSVQMQIALASAPDLIEIDIPKFDMTRADWQNGIVSFDCSVDLLINAAYPAYSFSPAYFPGLF